MDLTSIVFCPRCGAALDVSDDGAGGLTCADCGGRILLRRSATRTEAVALDDVEADRADALALLDRAWEEERGKHLLRGWKVLGVTVSWREPSDGMAVLWFGAGLAGATLILLRVATPAHGLPPAAGAAVVALVGVLAAVYELSAAGDLARARRRYAASRAKLERGVPLDRDDWSGDVLLPSPGARTRGLG